MKWNESGTNEEVHQLTVEAEWTELIADYDERVSEYRKLSIPGFRPGNAPQALIEKRFRKEMVEDLAQRVGHRLGREAIREADIEVWGPAEIRKIECEKGEAFRAELCFIPLPKLELPDFQCLENKDRDQISLELLSRVELDVPDRLVADELVLDGIDSTPGSAEWVAAADRVRLMMILKQIARQEGIEVDEKDVEDRIAEKANEFGTPPEKLLKELTRGQGGGLQRLRDMLIAESTFDYLTEKQIKN
jgi:FKBP-type peptidyl-prolyl cis-trans isomerase (trigger factor)